ncbi:hypothetical protein OROGR_015647 [Orobanche gracilis]
MGHRRPNCNQPATKSHTLSSSPTHSSSSDFEFTISSSHRKSSAVAADFCPADELFYKGQLLPLHLSPRLSMVRTLLLSSASTSSSSDTIITTSTTASRDSTASRSSSDFSGRPSSADDEPYSKRLAYKHCTNPGPKPASKYFPLPKLFRTEQRPPSSASTNPAKRVGSSAKEMMRRYLKKVKPLYEKLAQKQKAPTPPPPKPPPWRIFRSARNTLCVVAGHRDQELNNCLDKENRHASILNSFSGNLRLYHGGGARSYISSCPSSMGSSPNHGKSGFRLSQTDRTRTYSSYASSMEELQNAIQGAIAHCKNSMLQNQTVYGQ